MKYFPGKWCVISFSWQECLIHDQSFEYLLSGPSLLAGPILTPLPRKTSPDVHTAGRNWKAWCLTVRLTARDRYRLRPDVTGSDQAQGPNWGPWWRFQLQAPHLWSYFLFSCYSVSSNGRGVASLHLWFSTWNKDPVQETNQEAQITFE